MTDKITIVGAGLAGLLAGTMLARHRPRIIEAQSALPNNHSAVLRFRSDRVSEVTGISFKKVSLIKGTMPWNNPVADALMYAAKCTGAARSDRSIPVGIEKGERWIAPPDLIRRMAFDQDIHFSTPLNFNSEAISKGWKDPILSQPTISTMPMPALMKLLEYPDIPIFSSVPGANIRATIPNCDAYATLYIPSPEFGFNRISVTGDELIIEYAFAGGEKEDFNRNVAGSMSAVHSEVRAATQMLGLLEPYPFVAEVKLQQYAKIQPIDDIARKKFLAWATDNYNIFSLGRFATWRPGLLLDDLVHDVRLIERWIGDRYSMKATHR